jgi:COMPASS component SDC1
MADQVAKEDGPIDPLQASAAEELPALSETAQPAQPFAGTPQRDIIMSDAPTEQAASPAPIAHAPSPAPARTGTPAQGSRAASVHPDAGFTMPSEAPPHGDQVRQYLNTRVTGVLLEGMKQLAKDQPGEPLRVLGEYLIQKSRELEGTN